MPRAPLEYPRRLYASKTSSKSARSCVSRACLAEAAVAGPGNPGCLAHHGYGKFILASGQCLVDQGKDGGCLVHGRSPCFRVPLAEDIFLEIAPPAPDISAGAASAAAEPGWLCRRLRQTPLRACAAAAHGTLSLKLPACTLRSGCR